MKYDNGFLNRFLVRILDKNNNNVNKSRYDLDNVDIYYNVVKYDNKCNYLYYLIVFD